jgi:hypothetical protein
VVSTLYSKAASFGVLLVTSCKQEGCRRISFSGPTHGRPKNRRLPTVILSPCHSWCWRSKGPQEIGTRSGSSCQELQPLYTGVQNRVNCARTGIGRLERLLGGRPHQLDQRSPHNYFSMSEVLGLTTRRKESSLTKTSDRRKGGSRHPASCLLRLLSRNP